MKLPDVYLFNPTCEMAIANGTVSWQPNRLLQQMETDLGNLPQFFAAETDVVLVKRLPGKAFTDTLAAAGFSIPEFRLVAEALASHEFGKRPLNRLLPWGWSPATHRLLGPLKKQCSATFRASPVFSWQPSFKKLTSRETAAEWLQEIVVAANNHCFLSSGQLPKSCASVQEIEQLGQRWGKLMVKAPWSSSGRGLQPVTHFPVHPSVAQRISGLLREQQLVIAEPLLNKVADLGLIFQISPEKNAFTGFSHFLTNEKGQYAGNYLNGHLPGGSAELSIFLEEMKEKLPPLLLQIIDRKQVARQFTGPLGIDTLIFRDQNGKLKINPCLEINWRFTMGAVAQQLEKRVSPGLPAIFRTYHQPGNHFATFVREQQEKFPPVIRDGKLVSGFLPLTEPHPEAQFGAYLLAGFH